MAAPFTIGIEEEFQMVDPQTEFGYYARYSHSS